VIEPYPPIYFVRHGQTEWNRERRIEGWIDISLSNLDRRQSVAIACRLKKFLCPAPNVRFIVSLLTWALNRSTGLTRTVTRPNQ
jgi:broad specificity phosphatase PhoE